MSDIPNPGAPKPPQGMDDLASGTVQPTDAINLSADPERRFADPENVQFGDGDRTIYSYFRTPGTVVDFGPGSLHSRTRGTFEGGGTRAIVTTEKEDGSKDFFGIAGNLVIDRKGELIGELTPRETVFITLGEDATDLLGPGFGAAESVILGPGLRGEGERSPGAHQVDSQDPFPGLEQQVDRIMEERETNKPSGRNLPPGVHRRTTPTADPQGAIRLAAPGVRRRTPDDSGDTSILESGSQIAPGVRRRQQEQ